jgi:hypothetical protein
MNQRKRRKPQSCKDREGIKKGPRKSFKISGFQVSRSFYLSGFNVNFQENHKKPNI